MRVERIEQIEEVGGKVMLTMRLVLPCSFKPLLEWRRTLSDEKIINYLNKSHIDVTIRNGNVVEIRTKPKSSVHLPQQESRITQGEVSNLQVHTFQYFSKKSITDSSGGIRWCPNCRDPVATTEEWESGKVIYRCKKCGYPVGSS